MRNNKASLSNLAPRLSFQAITLTLLFCPAHAGTIINKCQLDDSTIYTDQFCPTEATSEPFTKQVTPPNDPAAAKKRYQTDQKNLQQLVQQRKKEEKHQDHENKVASNQIKEARRKEYQCNEWKLKHDSANQRQTVATSRGRTRKKEQAKLAVLQADYKMEYYCGTN